MCYEDMCIRLLILKCRELGSSVLPNNFGSRFAGLVGDREQDPENNSAISYIEQIKGGFFLPYHCTNHQYHEWSY